MNLVAAARAAAKRHNIDPDVFVAQIRQESGFKMNVGSSAGARDIAQFIPSTAKAYGVTLGDNNPLDDLDGAARYDADLLKRAGGDYRRMLSGYNSGRLDAYKDPSFANGQTYNYVKNIMAAAGSPASLPTRAHGSGAGATTTDEASSPNGGPTPAGTLTDVDTTKQRLAVAQNYFANRHDPKALLNLALGLRGIQEQEDTLGSAPAAGSPTISSSSPQPTTTTPGATKSASPAAFDGKKVAPWIAPILEYARQHGWQGGVNSGYRSDAEQTRIYNSGVRPAALPQSMGGGGSNHEFTAYPGGAVDVSNAAQLAKILQNSKYKNVLVWAGSKDPVHFSHPHNGSY